MEDNIVAAIQKGLSIIGISDHGYAHMGFGMNYDKIQYMREEMDRLIEKYQDSGVKILLGVECNILDDSGNIDMDDKIRPYFDYIMAGYHFGSKPTHLVRGMKNHFNNYLKPFKYKEIEYNTRALINAMRNNDLFVLTHPGDKGDIDIDEVADVAVETNTFLEINERHKNLSVDQLIQIKDKKVKYMVGSDGHSPDHIGVFDNAIERILESGIDLCRVQNILGGR